MHDPCTVLSGYKVTWNHSKSLFCIFSREKPRNKLLIGSTHKVCSLTLCQNLIRHLLAIFVISISYKICFLRSFEELCSKLLLYQFLSQHYLYRLKSILVKGTYQDIINLFAHCQSSIGWQCPRGSRPSKDIYCTLRGTKCFCCLSGKLLYLELSGNSRITYIAVATRLVKFMRGKPCPRLRRIRLYGISLVE